ncbi:MAG TPA: zinc-dependent alcohol dehydrogenase family protein, partial [Solirubrobacteraceae bacterium]|nr:zinc-dependent alcohol dehydrogenase family protein [Solirubrobacteraceae bacterium]
VNMRCMRAMALERIGQPLQLVERDVPVAGPGQLLVRVLACGVCRTDLHLVDGQVSIAELPRVLGHQIVGETSDGRIIGIPWLAWTDGTCSYCLSGRENLCPQAQFTGRDVDGGYAEWAVADERFCFPIPGDYPPLQAAPLLCAGLIGHRAYRMCGDARRIGEFGFGAAGHVLCQVAQHEQREIHAFTRPGDEAAQAFALELGATSATGSDRAAPSSLDAAIIFAPVGALVPVALRAVVPGGTVVCGGIHMSDIPSFPYSDLWEERVLRSVANLTRADAEEFLALAPQVPVRTHVHRYELEAANEALEDLRAGRFTGAAVVVP